MHTPGMEIFLLISLLFAPAILSLQASTPKASKAQEHSLKRKIISIPTEHQAHHDKSLPLPRRIHPIFTQSRIPLPASSSRRELQHKPYLSPLYPGYGTHFAYLWVGSPPQRQSVIVDTGSHFTAFPCTGCTDCGQHTDLYFAPESSSTASIPFCGDNQERCIISQRYSEGSEWTAYEVYDRLWVGGIDEMEVPTGEDHVVLFKFGCQTAETGLFKSQLADGIMGLSMENAALPVQLRDNGVADSSIFALCFHVGGGIFTLGGVDQRIHLNSDIKYARLTKQAGLYTINTIEVSLVTKSDPPDTFGFELDPNVYNSGKGTIIDSGTTDTFLPTSVQQRFNELFLQITGVDYTQEAIHLTYAQVAMMPNLVITAEGVNGDSVELVLPSSSYVDNLGGGKYAFRIYFQDDTGVVLGGNFFLEKNIIFDADNQRVGFAQSTCNFEEFTAPETSEPTRRPTKSPSATPRPTNTRSPDRTRWPTRSRRPTNISKRPTRPPHTSAPTPTEAEQYNYYYSQAPVEAAYNYYYQYSSAPSESPYYYGGDKQGGSTYAEDGCESALIPINACTARCDQAQTPAYVSEGKQDWSDRCGNKNFPGIGPWPCYQSCNMGKAVRGNPFCKEGPWSDCKKTCLQTRTVPSSEQIFNATMGKDGFSALSCHGTATETRSCYTGECPTNPGDYLVYIDLRIRLPPSQWSYVHTEAFFLALSELLSVETSSMELHTDPGDAYTMGTRIHIQIRLKAKDYPDLLSLNQAAQKIPMKIWMENFPDSLIFALESASLKLDSIDFSRYGWLQPSDISVLNSVALPIGTGHDSGLPTGDHFIPISNDKGNESDSKLIYGFSKVDLILVGVALASFRSVMIIIIIRLSHSFIFFHRYSFELIHHFSYSSV